MIEGLNGATGFKLRRIYNRWWLKLFKPLPGNDMWKNVGDYGPLEWAEVEPHTELLIEQGLFDIERELGSRGK